MFSLDFDHRQINSRSDKPRFTLSDDRYEAVDLLLFVVTAKFVFVFVTFDTSIF